jgi:putative sigma-54 modulation protein
MQVEIRSKDFPITPGIRSYTERRLGFALDRFAGRIQRAQVYVGDVNGPKGGRDKLCRIVVSVASATAVVEEVRPDLYRAIDRAASRAARKIAREVGRANRPAPPRFFIYQGVA